VIREYRSGSATDPQKPERVVIIAHICNDIGAWGRGFVLSVTQKWPIAEADYRAWYQGNIEDAPPFELGQVKFVRTKGILNEYGGEEHKVVIANMIAQHGILVKDDGSVPIRYDALEKCLLKVREMAEDCQDHGVGCGIHMPRIGCGLAGGKWSEVEPIVQRTLKDVDVYVYDFVSNDARTVKWNP
jgi:O-acetyl-ADP-ribose deacetylase (regulator of RNase III)